MGMNCNCGGHQHRHTQKINWKVECGIFAFMLLLVAVVYLFQH
jgi:hypothetical protein